MGATIKIPTLFTADDRFSGVVDQMTRKTNKFQKRLAGLERTNKRLNKFKYHALAGAAAIGVTVKNANDFQSSMSNVSTLLDTNSENMDQMGKDVLNLSKRLPVPINELTSSLYDIRSAGIDASKAMGTLETSGRLSVAGLSTTEEATNILTSAMNAFKNEGLSSTQIANILFKTVKAGKTTISQLATGFGPTAAIIESAGVKLMDFQAATAALTISGTPAVQAQNQIKAAMIQLKKPTADMIKIFGKLGVTTGKELIEREGGIVGAMESIAKAGKKSGLNLAKAWSSSEALAAVSSLTGSAKQSYLDTIKDMASGTDALSGAFKKQSETEANQLKLAKNNMQALSITIGTKLAPMITKLTKAFTPLIESATKFIERNDWVLNSIPLVIGLFIAFKMILFGARAAMVANNIVMGIQAARIGAMSIAMKGNIIAQGAFKVAMAIGTAATWIATAAQTAFAFAVNAGLWPILLVVAAITAVVAIIMNWSAITDWFGKKWDQFTKLISKAWANVMEYFTKTDLKTMFMDIGQSILKFMLLPLRTMLFLLSKIPGKVGELAGMGLDKIDEVTGNIDVNAPANETLPSTTQASSENVSRSISEKNSSVRLDIVDKGGNVGNVTNDDGIPVSLGPTMGAF